jgi:hypothetical protein
MLPLLCGLCEFEGETESTNDGQSHNRNVAREDSRRRKWPAMTSKLNDNKCDRLSPQNFTMPAWFSL